ncbi:hypothetical protein OF83DRAFT_1089443 [Amylostereum chailletii]|nr:hypothetical protein OF83DRAFT_1089443 [Amylostereum chailletii]
MPRSTSASKKPPLTSEPAVAFVEGTLSPPLEEESRNVEPPIQHLTRSEKIARTKRERAKAKLAVQVANDDAKLESPKGPRRSKKQALEQKVWQGATDKKPTQKKWPRSDTLAAENDTVLPKRKATGTTKNNANTRTLDEKAKAEKRTNLVEMPIATSKKSVAEPEPVLSDERSALVPTPSNDADADDVASSVDEDEVSEMSSVEEEEVFEADGARTSTCRHNMVSRQLAQGVAYIADDPVLATSSLLTNVPPVVSMAPARVQLDLVTTDIETSESDNGDRNDSDSNDSDNNLNSNRLQPAQQKQHARATPSRPKSKVPGNNDGLSPRCIADLPSMSDSEDGSLDVKPEIEVKPSVDAKSWTTWPEDTNLTLNDKGGLSMNAQKSRKVHDVLQQAVNHQLPRLLFSKHAYPIPSANRDDLMADALMDAANDLKHGSIFQRLFDDTAYANKMSELPRDRTSNICSKIYCSVVHVNVFSFYGLDRFNNGADDAINKGNIALAVTSLLKDDAFIFPGRFKADGTWRFTREEPFSHPAFAKLVALIFSGPNTIHPFPTEFYTSSMKEGVEAHEREIPVAMVAFLATAIRAALSECIYSNHVATLMDELTLPVRHGLLNLLYDDIFTTSTDNGAVKGTANIHIESDKVAAALARKHKDRSRGLAQFWRVQHMKALCG